MLKTFNINQWVYVRLNETGKQELLRQAAELRENNPKIKHDYSLPKEDEEGWSKWQMHSLMNAFGHMMVLGLESPFDTEIRIEFEG